MFVNSWRNLHTGFIILHIQSRLLLVTNRIYAKMFWCFKTFFLRFEVNWAFWGNLEIQGKTILIFKKVSWMNYSETLRALPSRHKGALSYREDTRITYRRSFWRSWQITCWSKLLPLTIYSKPAITRSKLTIETIGKGVEFIQS